MSVEPQWVEKLLEVINGKYYKKRKTGASNLVRAKTDQRHSVMNTLSRKTFHGNRKTGKCEGHYVCPKNCSFLKSSAKPQKTQHNYVLKT